MFIQIPADTYTGVNLYLWIVSIILQFIAAIVVSLKASKVKEIKSLRSLLFGYGFFFLALGANRIFFLWAYFSPLYRLFLSIGYMCAAIALTPVIYALEKYILPKTRFLFTIFCLSIFVLSGLSALLPEELEQFRSAIQVMSLLTSIIWFFLYFWIIKMTAGAPRKKAIMIVLSVIIALSGFTLDAEFVLTLGIFPPYIAPILYAVGVFCLMLVLLKDD